MTETTTVSKACIRCGRRFPHRDGINARAWAAMHYCSRECSRKAARERALDELQAAAEHNPYLLHDRPCIKCGQMMHRPVDMELGTWAVMVQHRGRCPAGGNPRMTGADVAAYARTAAGRAFVNACRRGTRPAEGELS